MTLEKNRVARARGVESGDADSLGELIRLSLPVGRGDLCGRAAREQQRNFSPVVWAAVDMKSASEGTNTFANTEKAKLLRTS